MEIRSTLLDNGEIIGQLKNIADILREEMMQHRNWSFNGSFEDFDNPQYFCLPDFVKKGKNIWFAIDNIDRLEDTPTGQNTFLGTVIVINQ